MSRTRIGVLVLLVAAPLLAAAAALTFGGDRPVSDDGPAPSSSAADPMGTVTGVATTADGRPVSGAAVLVTPLDDPAPAVPELGVLTGVDGRYEWRLPPGRYELVAQAGERTGEPGTATVTAGARTRLDLTVP
nr:carboxypeptidase-like regulatory domain-containing protein [Micromonospora sp. DSM 115978]